MQDKFKIDGKELIPGKDFLIDPSSKSRSGKFKLAKLDKNIANNQHKLSEFLSRDFSKYFV